MKTQDILKPLRLRCGPGGSFEKGLCFMEVVSWLGGEECSDTPDCACPVLGELAIRLNDSLSHENRQKLIPLAFDMLGTRSKEHEKARAEYLVVQVGKRIISQAFDKANMPEIATLYRAAKTIGDIKEISIHAKSAIAAYDASASTSTYASAYAADNAACAADACAAANYTAAATYAAGSATCAAAPLDTLLQCMPILQEAIKLGPNGVIDDVVIERAVNLSAYVKENLSA